MTSTEAAALRDLVLRTEAAVPTIDARRLAEVYVAILAGRERERAGRMSMGDRKPVDKGS